MLCTLLIHYQLSCRQDERPIPHMGLQALNDRYGVGFASFDWAKNGDLFFPIILVLLYFAHVPTTVQMMINAVKTKKANKHLVVGSSIGADGGAIDRLGKVIKETTIAFEKPMQHALDTGKGSHFYRSWVVFLTTMLYILPRMACGILFILQFEIISARGLYNYAVSTLFLFLVTPTVYNAALLAVLKNQPKLAFSLCLIADCVEICILVLFSCMHQWLVFGLHFIPTIWVGILGISSAIYTFANPKTLEETEKNL